MTGKEMILLARAVEMCAADSGRVDVTYSAGTWTVGSPSGMAAYHFSAATLEDALTAILVDLGEPAPSPTAEKMAAVLDFIDIGTPGLAVLREAWATHREEIITLLEGGDGEGEP